MTCILFFNFSIHVCIYISKIYFKYNVLYLLIQACKERKVIDLVDYMYFSFLLLYYTWFLHSITFECSHETVSRSKWHWPLHFLHFVDSCWCYFGAEKLPTPVKMREGGPNEDAQMSEFQQELIQLAAVLKGDNILTSFPGKIGKDMTVKQGKDYMDDAVRRFFEAGRYAKKMGVNEEHIVQMKPSLTTRSSKSSNRNP